LDQVSAQVLVVEDDQLQLIEIADTLAECGKQICVMETCSVDEFKRLARGSEFVIFDIDFFTNRPIAIRGLRKVLNSEDIQQLLIITDGSVSADLHGLTSDSRVRVLLKPFGSKELLNKIGNKKIY
jgi:DNA-binding response OmpR family regulator